MRAWWPLLWLLPTIAGMAAIAWRIAGREAATVALLLALVGVPAYQQFTPGRIDHHNVQIALTLLVTAATVWSDRKSLGRDRGRPAHRPGAGDRLREPCPISPICGGVLALRYVLDPEAGAALRDYGLALAGEPAVALLRQRRPGPHWRVHSLRQHRRQQLPRRPDARASFWRWPAG